MQPEYTDWLIMRLKFFCHFANSLIMFDYEDRKIKL